MKNYFGLGCLKDPKDLRDLPMGLVLPPIRLPDKIDYTKHMTPVRDQGDEGTIQIWRMYREMLAL